MIGHFNILDLPLAGVKLIERKPIADTRGYLERLFCVEDFHELIRGKRIVQINHTFTVRRGTVRGIHFQHPPHSEAKFVSCSRGEVFDVVVDLRRDSPSFLKWHAETLSAENHKTLMIPEGCAHGFQTLTEDCEMLYFHTAAYQPHAEGGVNALDPKLAIPWPLSPIERSARDMAHLMLTGDFTGIVA